jgi:hypothetical protein
MVVSNPGLLGSSMMIETTITTAPSSRASAWAMARVQIRRRLRE